jgi:hypothetical protein
MSSQDVDPVSSVGSAASWLGPRVPTGLEASPDVDMASSIPLPPRPEGPGLDHPGPGVGVRDLPPSSGFLAAVGSGIAGPMLSALGPSFLGSRTGPLFPWVPDWSPPWQKASVKLSPLRHCTDWELFKSNGTVLSDEDRQKVFDAYVVRMLMSVRSSDVLSRMGRQCGLHLVALGWVYRAVHPNRITSCHEFLNASKHLETWVFMQPDGGSVDLNVDSWEPESTWVQGRITPGDRTNVSLLVNFMSKEISRLPPGRTRSNLNCGDRKMVTFSLPPDFPRQHRVPLEVEERVSKFFEECLQVVKGDFHESVMLLKALSALRDESQDFARQYTLVEYRVVSSEAALRMTFRDILAWKIWMGPVRMSVASPSTYRVNY